MACGARWRGNGLPRWVVWSNACRDRSRSLRVIGRVVLTCGGKYVRMWLSLIDFVIMACRNESMVFPPVPRPPERPPYMAWSGSGGVIVVSPIHDTRVYLVSFIARASLFLSGK